MKRPSSARKRGEGHVEYVVITVLIMICATVSLFSFFDAAKQVALDRRLCLDCLDRQQVRTLDAEEDEDAASGDASAEDEEAEDRPRTSDEELADLRARHGSKAPFIWSVADMFASIFGSSHVVGWLRDYFYPPLPASNGDTRFAEGHRPLTARRPA